MSAGQALKTVTRAADLAINGAAPAFADGVPVGRPNIGDRARFHQLIDEMFDRRWLSNDGPLLKQFEAQVAGYLGARHCVAMCNGTVALEVAARALGLTGEVIVPSFTFIATAHALRWIGLTPVFADVDPVTHNLDPRSVREAITPRTSAIMGVHLWGRAAPVEALQNIADEHGLALMFDAAHAFGCSHEGRMIGSFGACEVLSFHATKFFNSFEGGAVITNDDALADKLRQMRNFGFITAGEAVSDGANGKMIEPAAAMGIVNLEMIETVVALNKRNQQAYRAGLEGLLGISLITFADNERSNYQYVVAEIAPEFGVSRDDLLAALVAENILARKYFWPGCHRQAPYRDLDPDAGLRLPVTEQLSQRVLVLPTGSAVDLDDVALICAIIRTVAATGSSTKAG